MKKIFFYVVAIVCTPFLAAETAKNNTAPQQPTTPTVQHAPKFSSPFGKENDIVRSFLQPVQFTRTGMDEFFRTVFNSTLYSERFLPSCFVHMIDFFEYSKKNNKPYSFYESVFLLFHHRLKESSWINSYALLMFMEQLPEYLEVMPASHHEKMMNLLKVELQKAVNDRSFLLKDRADNFYTETAERILSSMKTAEADGTLRDVQKSLTTFLEHSFGKLIWNPHEKEDIWKTIKLLAQKCELLYKFGCLANTDDLNRLIWSLLYRFGYFIDCAGSQLPVEFYQTIRDDLKKEPLTFLTLEESEKWLVPKNKYFEGLLDKGEIKAHAFKQGILSDVRTM